MSLHRPVWESEADRAVYTNGELALEAAATTIDPVEYLDYETPIHFYWRSPGEFGRKQALCIRAALATQNIATCPVILWSNISLCDNEHLQPLLPYIEHHPYYVDEQAPGTPVEGWPGIHKQDKECYLDGDLARLLLLYKYGGVWVDCDMVLLRDLSPLLPLEFMYQWGTETASSVQKERINGAIMRMFRRSTLAKICLQELMAGNGGASSTDWGSVMYSRVRDRYKQWTVFPGAYFNTEWQLGYNMGESAHPFRSVSADVPLWLGRAFSWHWHGKWDHPIQSGCKFERLERYINELFEAKFNEKVYRVDPRWKHLGGNIAGGDSASDSPELWDFLRGAFRVRSVLDVGCGEGQAVRWFKGQGCQHCYGFDGLPINIERAPQPECFVHDLKNGPIHRNVDLVWCCEVAEHIDPVYHHHLAKTLASGEVIAMTYAVPGQSGWHHVNCQSEEYWIRFISSFGYKFERELTTAARGVAGDTKHFGRTGLIFTRRSGI